MSKKPSKYSEILNSDQTPTSPAELDRKILQYAKSHQPAARTRARWAPILATISVVSIAVLITLQSPKMNEFEDAGRRDLDSLSSAAKDSVEGSLERSTKTRTTAKTANDNFFEEHPEAAALRMNDAVKDKAFSFKSAKAPAPAIIYTPNENEISQAAPPQQVTRKKDSLQDTLKNLSKLLKEGSSDKAYSGYEQLRKSCFDCELPDTLEQALEQLFN